MKKFISVIVIIILILSYGIYRAFFDMNNLPEGRLISEVHSPNGEYTIKAYISDGDATTSYAVRGELIFNTIKKNPKNIYWNYREDNAKIEWIDNDTVIINGHKLNVPNERFDFRRK
ncbi:hypothetical protein DFR58_1401 [Anaerobacterium chartisolvens]|uniref:DUF5412 domain-containing protein n=1 Tax=Anaerobacterium chartisolvens TaxID=1297424 RepID=A0A369AHQ6_9FIRM|nr:DUF5412 domain-containing protein [Anaerobacterium chartisolvens]RCX08890.1 hypothetical protein DFR58_1401 [Anaerobacterium chartisolvens]